MESLLKNQNILERSEAKETVMNLSGVEAVLKYDALKGMKKEWSLPGVLSSYLMENEENEKLVIKKLKRVIEGRNKEFTVLNVKDLNNQGRIKATIFIEWNLDMDPEAFINPGFNPSLERAGLFIRSMNITASSAVIAKLKELF
ncbi:MAG: hypothetical protein HYX22_01415 [Candidatus Yanofskybacteria bacterium]|nr:hypothetical protein [Candidatus Yanofskybacteria bacterium]